MNDVQAAIQRGQGSRPALEMDALIAELWMGDHACTAQMVSRWRRGTSYPIERNRDALLSTLARLRKLF